MKKFILAFLFLLCFAMFADAQQVQVQVRRPFPVATAIGRGINRVVGFPFRVTAAAFGFTPRARVVVNTPVARVVVGRAPFVAQQFSAYRAPFVARQRFVAHQQFYAAPFVARQRFYAAPFVAQQVAYTTPTENVVVSQPIVTEKIVTQKVITQPVVQAETACTQSIVLQQNAGNYCGGAAQFRSY